MSASPPEEPGIAVSVPRERVPARAILPALYQLVEAHTRESLAAVAAEGRSISCKAGCGACCRMFVPISDVEAHALAALVERMPEPRRATIKQRFADAENRLADWRPLDTLIQRSATAIAADHDQMLADYFRLGIACPFLEDESCSIHPDRPLVCREYFVTSPAEFCASHDRRREIKGVKRKFVAPALQYLTSDTTPPRSTVMPITLVLRWVSRQTGREGKRRGIDWLKRFSRILQDLAQHHRLTQGKQP